MDTWHIDLSREAAAAISALSGEDRQIIDRTIQRLSAGPNPPGVPQSYKLRGDPEVYVLRAGGRFRILYTANVSGSIVVQDVVNHDSVREYFTRVAR